MGTFLTRNQLRAYLQPLDNGMRPLVENMVDPKVQVQPAGIDLSLQKIFSFESSASLAFTQTETTLPTFVEVAFDATDRVFLSPGPYKALLNEIVNIPPNLVGIARPRSTLARSGVSAVTALWDPGYSGRSEVAIVVHNPHGLTIARNTRLIQLCFWELDEALGEGQGYAGRYQLENLEKLV